METASTRGSSRVSSTGARPPASSRQAHVNRMENRALADGSISRGEFRRIEQAQNAQRRHIYRQKHDRQHRPNR
jgi:hypothetical protein